MIESTMDKKLQNVATKEDIAVMKGSIDIVVEENRRLKDEVAQLKQDTRVLREQVNESRNLMTRNKLIIRGMKVPEGMLLTNAVLDLLENVLKVADVNIVQTFFLGKPLLNKPSLILVEFATYKDVIRIYKNVNKLKGTGIVIHDDVTYESRIKRGRLRRIMKHCSGLNGNIVSKMRGDVLTVGGRKFTWSEGELITCDRSEDGVAALDGITGLDLGEFIRNMDSEERDKVGRQGGTTSSQRL